MFQCQYFFYFNVLHIFTKPEDWLHGPLKNVLFQFVVRPKAHLSKVIFFSLTKRIVTKTISSRWSISTRKGQRKEIFYLYVCKLQWVVKRFVVVSGAAVNKKKLVALDNSSTCYGVTSIARMYLQTHYDNVVFGNVYLKAFKIVSR